MRAAIFNEPGSVSVVQRPDATVRDPTDAVVRVVSACVCGSDLWFYRGLTSRDPGPVGHELIGVVEAVGAQVTTLRRGDLVICPFAYSDGTCPHCLHGIHTACVNGGYLPDGNGDGGQGEAVRIPWADGTLVKVPGGGHSAETLASLLTLSDVMGTGYHAAVCAQVKPGDSVAVVGDGAVGLCAVLSARLLGAERIIMLSRHHKRQELALAFGATDIVQERGEQAVSRVLELTAGIGVDAALECVGTGESIQTAIGIARPFSVVGYVGVPHGVEFPVRAMFRANKGVLGGPAPVRQYLPALLDEVLTSEPHTAEQWSERRGGL
ncbi:MAG: zinc-binding dehydrogenase, partial [Solirubrobacteraceae bacterium]